MEYGVRKGWWELLPDWRPFNGLAVAPEHSASVLTVPGLTGSFRNRIVPTPVSEVIGDTARALAYDVKGIPDGFRPPDRKSSPNPVHGNP